MKRLAGLAILAATLVGYTTGCSSMPATERTARNVALAGDFNQHLLAVVADPVYNHAVDHQLGGFRQKFDRKWNDVSDPTARFSVYQARATYAAAAIANDRKGLRERFSLYATHGYAELRDVLWDKVAGGLFWGCNADGSSNEKYGDNKYTFGQAYGILALAEYYALTKDPEARNFARKSFIWLEDHGRDKTNGGYYEVLTREGTRVGRSGLNAPDKVTGWPVGQKSASTTLRVFEAYLRLQQADPQLEVRTRLQSLYLIIRDKLILTETGSLGERFEDDWTPTSQKVSYAQNVEAAQLLMAAAKELGLRDAKMEALARRMVDRALDHAFDWDRGGLYENEPDGAEGNRRPKLGWAQPEMLLALATMHERFGDDDDRYWNALQLQWKALEADFTDRTPVGRVKAISATGQHDYTKADDWTDPYHDTRALLAASRILRGLKETD